MVKNYCLLERKINNTTYKNYLKVKPKYLKKFCLVLQLK